MSVLLNLSLTVSASFLFFLSHPNVLFQQGLGFLGFVELVPIFFAISRSKPRNVWCYGLLYGALSYGLLSYWMAGYSFVALCVCLPAFALIMAVVFELMCAASRLYPEKKFYMMALVWLVYEFLKVKGFLGYPYGIIGYTQWKNVLLLQSSSIGGVWWISAVCVFCSSIVAAFVDLFLSVTRGEAKKEKPKKGVPPKNDAKKNAANKNVQSVLNLFWRKEGVFVSVFGVLLLFSIVYGAVRLNQGDGETKRVRTLCVQNNTDSNKYGFEVYRRDVSVLKSLTEDALSKNGGVDFVVWPETAVVPPFMYNYENPVEPNRHAMVLDLLDFMQKSDSCFVFGNQTTVDNGGEFSDDYNSVLVFDSRRGNVEPPNPERYYKIHLVPFTEYFPYGKIFPHLYEKLLDGDSHLWTPGTEYKVFDERGIRFSTPICFEDTFGNLCREFVKNGAVCLFNLSNDSWSKSLPCQFQHLSMAVFRSSENAVPSVRSTASGVTCSIDSRGRVVSMVDCFEKKYLVADMDVQENYAPTFYNRFGDWLPILETAALVVLVVLRLIRAEGFIPRPFGRNKRYEI